jgi:hypothetical protein
VIQSALVEPGAVGVADATWGGRLRGVEVADRVCVGVEVADCVFEIDDILPHPARTTNSASVQSRVIERACKGERCSFEHRKTANIFQVSFISMKTFINIDGTTICR